MSRPSVSGAPESLFSAEGVTLPRDPSVVTLNRRHNRFDPVGRAVLLEKRPEGVYAEFAIADTDEGDAYLRDEVDGLRMLSAELAAMVREGVRVVASKLTGAALVEEPALPGAGLFAAVQEVTTTERLTFDDGTGWETTTERVEVRDDDGTTTVTAATVDRPLDGPEDPDAPTATADEDPEDPEDPDAAAATDDDDTDPEEEDTADMARMTPGTIATAPRPTLDGMFAALARQDHDAMQAYRGAGELFAALQHSGPGAATIGADTARPDYLGELWKRAPYARRFVPLVGTAQLTSWSMIGWQWVDGKTPTMDDYAGNVAPVPSNALDTEPVTVTAARLAGGHTLDRRYVDFGDQEVVASYVIHQTDDYKRKSDGKVLAAVKAAAVETALGKVPAGVAPGLAAIVDGALGVIGSENTPAYALVEPALWRDILLTPKDDILAYLSMAFGLDEGEGLNFKLRPAALDAGEVIVGAKEALTFYELGDTPIRVDGLQPGNGATEVAAFGYWATLVNNAQAIRKVTVPAAAA